MLREARRLLLIIPLIAIGVGPVGLVQGHPKYVIFLIGDGMGFDHVKAAGMCAYGEPGMLFFEAFPFSGEVMTSPAGGGITDSAAAIQEITASVKVHC
jgi:alkaline phosphatase